MCTLTILQLINAKTYRQLNTDIHIYAPSPLQLTDHASPLQHLQGMQRLLAQHSVRRAQCLLGRLAYSVQEATELGRQTNAGPVATVESLSS